MGSLLYKESEGSGRTTCRISSQGSCLRDLGWRFLKQQLCREVPGALSETLQTTADGSGAMKNIYN